MEKELSRTGARIASAGRDAYQASRSYVKAEAIKIDKFYQSASNMLGDYAPSWAFMP